MATADFEQVKDIVTKYGDKQTIGRMAAMGMIEPTTAVLAGMMIDRITQQNLAGKAPTSTVAQDVFAPPGPMLPGGDMLTAGAPPMPQQPMPQQPMPQPPMPQQPQQPQMMRAGGVAMLPVPDQMYEYKGGGIVAFQAGGMSKEDLDLDTLVAAVTQVESRGNPRAVSPKGAVGLMQVMPATAMQPGYGVPNIFQYYTRQTGRTIPKEQQTRAKAVEILNDPAINQGFGRQYLQAMLRRYNGNLDAALVAYNAGPRRADRWVEKENSNVAKLPRETRNYIPQVRNEVRKLAAAPKPETAIPSGQGQFLGDFASAAQSATAATEGATFGELASAPAIPSGVGQFPGEFAGMAPPTVSLADQQAPARGLSLLSAASAAEVTPTAPAAPTRNQQLAMDYAATRRAQQQRQMEAIRSALSGMPARTSEEPSGELSRLGVLGGTDTVRLPPSRMPTMPTSQADGAEQGQFLGAYEDMAPALTRNQQLAMDYAANRRSQQQNDIQNLISAITRRTPIAPSEMTTATEGPTYAELPTARARMTDATEGPTFGELAAAPRTAETRAQRMTRQAEEAIAARKRQGLSALFGRSSTPATPAEQGQFLGAYEDMAPALTRNQQLAMDYAANRRSQQRGEMQNIASTVRGLFASKPQAQSAGLGQFLGAYEDMPPPGQFLGTFEDMAPPLSRTERERQRRREAGLTTAPREIDKEAIAAKAKELSSRLNLPYDTVYRQLLIEADRPQLPSVTPGTPQDAVSQLGTLGGTTPLLSDRVEPLWGTVREFPTSTGLVGARTPPTTSRATSPDTPEQPISVSRDYLVGDPYSTYDGTPLTAASKKPPAAPAPAAPAAPAATRPTEEDYMKRAQGVLGERPTSTVKSLSDYLRDISENIRAEGGNPDVFRRQADELRSQREELKMDRKEAANLRLLEAGLAILGGTSPYAFVNIGKGASQAMQGFAKDVQDLRKSRIELDKTERALETAQTEFAIKKTEAARSMMEKAEDRNARAQEAYNKNATDLATAFAQIDAKKEATQVTREANKAQQEQTNLLRTQQILGKLNYDKAEITRKYREAFAKETEMLRMQLQTEQNPSKRKALEDELKRLADTTDLRIELETKGINDQIKSLYGGMQQDISKFDVREISSK